MHRPASFCAAVRACAFPNDFTSEIIFSHYRIAKQLEIMRGGRVAVEIKRAGGFQDAVQFDETRGHHREVSHHVVATEEGHKGLHHFIHLAGLLGEFPIHRLGVLVPTPGVLECLNLAGGSAAVLFLKEGVVVCVRLEGRIKINEVNRFILDVSLENIEVVAVIKRSHAEILRRKSISVNPRSSAACLSQLAASAISSASFPKKCSAARPSPASKLIR